MYNCPNCGAQMSDTDTKCKNCGYMPVIDAEIINEEVKDDPIRRTINENINKFENTEGLKTIVKVLLILMVIFFPVAGPLIGIFVSIYLMNDAYSIEKRSFGKTLLGISILALILGIVFCCVSKTFGFLRFLLFGH